jgi:hypothetical protein
MTKSVFQHVVILCARAPKASGFRRRAARLPKRARVGRRLRAALKHKPRAMRWWKIAGLAGLAGVAATGVVIAREERRRQAYTPDEIRERLHARLSETPEAAESRPDES